MSAVNLAGNTTAAAPTGSATRCRRAQLTRQQIVLPITQLWILALIVGSLQPARPSPVLGLHREVHFLAFAGVAFLLLFLSRNRARQIGALCAAFLLGLSLETLQHLIYRNAMEWRDVRDDTLAIVAAFALFCLVRMCKAAFLASRSTPTP